MNVFESTEKKKMTMKAEKIIMDIEELSKDLKEICLRRDQILDEMSDIKVDVEELKRLMRYHPEKEHKHSRKCKVEEKGKSLKPEKKKKLFPPELGEKLIKDVSVDDPYNLSDIQELQTLYAPAVKRCCTKQPAQSAPCTASPTSLGLLLLKDVEDVLGEIPPQVQQQQPGTVSECTVLIFV